MQFTQNQKPSNQYLMTFTYKNLRFKHFNSLTNNPNIFLSSDFSFQNVLLYKKILNLL